MSRVIGYARVSTAEQASTDALDQQIARLKAAGAAEILIDVESGRSDKRKNFNKLVEMAIAGMVDEVVVTRLDRLGRTVITIHRTLESLQKSGVKLKILDAPIGDSDSPFTWFGLSQMAALAEFESRLLSNRISHGIEYSRQQGKTHSKIPFGYQRADNDKLQPDNCLHPCGLTYFQLAREMVDIYRKHGVIRRAITEIDARFGYLWRAAGLRDWLHNGSLRGHTIYFRRKAKETNNPSLAQIIYNTHPALISEEEYQEILNLLKKAKEKWGVHSFPNQNTDYPLSGQIYCAVCGNRCYRMAAVRRYKGDYAFWDIRCSKRSENTRLCTNSKAIRLLEIEKTVVRALTTKALQIAKFAVEPEASVESPELINLRQQLLGLQALGDNPALEQAREAIKLQIAQQINACQSRTIVSNENLTLYTEQFRDPDTFLAASECDRRIVYRELVERVSVDRGQVQSVVLREF